MVSLFNISCSHDICSVWNMTGTIDALKCALCVSAWSIFWCVCFFTLKAGKKKTVLQHPQTHLQGWRCCPELNVSLCPPVNQLNKCELFFTLIRHVILSSAFITKKEKRKPVLYCHCPKASTTIYQTAKSHEWLTKIKSWSIIQHFLTVKFWESFVHHNVSASEGIVGFWTSI